MKKRKGDDNILEINQVYNENCIGENGMCLIDDKSVDMILCDLPFNKTANKWDVIIPFDKLWEQYNRIIKNNGAIVLFAMQPFASMLIMSNIDMFKYERVWCKDKPTGFQIAKIKPLTKHENILIFGRGKILYNPQFEESKPMNTVYKRGGDKSSSVACGISRINTKEEDLNTTKRYPTTLLYANTVNNNSKEKLPHPTQKPVNLFENLIKTYSNEGDLVLDNCMGSFTTAVACINTNRNYIGFEMDKGYYDLGCKRVEDLKLKLD